MWTRIVVVGLCIVSLAGCATVGQRAADKDQREVEKQTTVADDTVAIDQNLKPAADDVAQPAVVHHKALTAKQMQRALKKAGHYAGPIDGKIGPKTRRAIVEFQKEQGLKPDGIVGKKTTAALREYLP